MIPTLVPRLGSRVNRPAHPALAIDRHNSFPSPAPPNFPTLATSTMNKILPLIAGATLIVSSATHGAEKIKALIVDGQNNHSAWPKSTIIMRDYLKATGLFEVDIARTKYT